MSALPQERPVPLPVPASRAAYDAAVRPVGGKRKRRTPRSSHVPAWLDLAPATIPEHVGRRERRDDDATLLNASDAANLLAGYSDFWTGTQILAHSELANLLVERILQALADEEAHLLRHRFRRQRGHRLAEVASEARTVTRAAHLLRAAQSRSLVVGD